MIGYPSLSCEASLMWRDTIPLGIRVIRCVVCVCVCAYVCVCEHECMLWRISLFLQDWILPSRIANAWHTLIHTNSLFWITYEKHFEPRQVMWVSALKCVLTLHSTSTLRGKGWYVCVCVCVCLFQSVLVGVCILVCVCVCLCILQPYSPVPFTFLPLGTLWKECKPEMSQNISVWGPDRQSKYLGRGLGCELNSRFPLR